MSNVISFLERMGRDAQLRHASHDELELVLTGAGIDSELHAAILTKDQTRLEVLLGSVNVCCMVNPVKEDEDEEGEESPSKDDEEVTLQSPLHVMASVG